MQKKLTNLFMAKPKLPQTYTCTRTQQSYKASSTLTKVNSPPLKTPPSSTSSIRQQIFNVRRFCANPNMMKSLDAPADLHLPPPKVQIWFGEAFSFSRGMRR